MVSFLLEGIFSYYIPISTAYWLPVPTLLSICFCHIYFLKHKNYIWFCFLFGILYDIVFTNTLFLHGTLFVVMGFISQKICRLISHTWYQFFLFILVLVAIYRLFTYIILITTGYFPFELSYFLSITMASFLWNLIYGIILYGIDYFILKRKFSKRLF